MTRLQSIEAQALKIIRSALLAAIVASFPIMPAAAEDRDARREGRALIKPCKACHDLRREKRKFGPHLVGIVGRPVASADKYRYSDPLKALGGVWTEARLAEFINAPNAYAPGTNMKFKGFNDMAKARMAAAYLVRKSAR